MRQTEVILVNEQDEPIGVMEKMQAHREGQLHRAFSVFIFDSRGRMLLQQRSPEKYHGGGLWTNACCSHPYPEEPIADAAHRRVQEELGCSLPLEKIFSFIYHAQVENNLIEHELDHVFAGEYEGEIHANPHEVADCAYEDMDQIRWALKHRPERFTSWFRIAFPRIEEWWQERYLEVVKK